MAALSKVLKLSLFRFFFGGGRMIPYSLVSLQHPHPPLYMPLTTEHSVYPVHRLLACQTLSFMPGIQ